MCLPTTPIYFINKSGHVILKIYLVTKHFHITSMPLICMVVLHYESAQYVGISYVAMKKIGFSQRIQTVSEADVVVPDEDIITVTLSITADSVASTEYKLLLQQQESNSTALVESTSDTTRTDFDALFGTRDTADQPLKEFHALYAGEISFRTYVYIRNDFVIEEEECFTVNLSSRGVVPFLCNDDALATSFFCSHTICIEDDDGTKMFVSYLLLIQFLSIL